MRKKFLVVGCGNIGSRHLQSLTLLPYKMNIDIVDPNTKSIFLAKKKLNEINPLHNNIELSWHNSLRDITDPYDLVIVATSAMGRVSLIQNLLKLGNNRFLIEKMVCQSVDEYDLLLSIMKTFQAKGWVNTNRRYFDTYREIQKILQNNQKINLFVIGANPRLGTSAIHYIDLFCWLINDYEVELSGKLLINKLFPNKRGDMLNEFAGTIMATGKNKSTLFITFIPDSDLPTTVNIFGEKDFFILDESNEKIISQNISFQNKYDFKFRHTSELTKFIVEDIVNNDFCKLPTLDDSYHIHCELFRIFNNHIKKLTNRDIQLCPIT